MTVLCAVLYIALVTTLTGLPTGTWANNTWRHR